MDDREKAIVTAFTGITMLAGERLLEFYKYLEELFGRPVYTHEIPRLAEEIKKRSRDDFIALCMEKEEPQWKWIPFKMRPLTVEEKEQYPESQGILVGALPEDGEHILVNIKCNRYKGIIMDEYHDDDGSYLDSGYELCTEATHWRYAPQPPKEVKWQVE